MSDFSISHSFSKCCGACIGFHIAQWLQSSDRLQTVNSVMCQLYGSLWMQIILKSNCTLLFWVLCTSKNFKKIDQKLLKAILLKTGQAMVNKVKDAMICNPTSNLLIICQCAHGTICNPTSNLSIICQCAHGSNFWYNDKTQCDMILSNICPETDGWPALFITKHEELETKQDECKKSEIN